MKKAFSSIRSSTSNLIQNNQTSTEIRRCLELVQLCHDDLQRLIELRNAQLLFLQARPGLLEHVNRVIELADAGLNKARGIVGKYHPDITNRTRASLQGQIGWFLGTSADFWSQEPIIASHHSAVLAELSFLRQIALWGDVSPVGINSVAVAPKSPPSAAPEERVFFKDTVLLGDIFEADAPKFSDDAQLQQLQQSTPSPHPIPPPPPPASAPVPTTIHKIEYSDLPEAVIPNALPEFTPKSYLHNGNADTSSTFQHHDRRSTPVLSPQMGEHAGLASLLKTQTMESLPAPPPPPAMRTSPSRLSCQTPSSEATGTTQGFTVPTALPPYQSHNSFTASREPLTRFSTSSFQDYTAPKPEYSVSVDHLPLQQRPNMELWRGNYSSHETESLPPVREAGSEMRTRLATSSSQSNMMGSKPGWRHTLATFRRRYTSASEGDADVALGLSQPHAVHS